MMNQIILVGRLSEDFKKGKVDDIPTTKITLAVPRALKDDNGEYITDYIPILLRGEVSDKTLEYCKKGDVIAVKGTIQTSKNTNALHIFGEKISFLSSKGGDD